jgi:phage gpG-like protein
MRFGTAVYYARMHQYADRFSKVHVPQRQPLLPNDQRTRRRMVRDVQFYLMGRTRGLTW